MDYSVCVLFRSSKKSGEIDTTITALGSALLKLWAMENTKPSKQCIILDRETGKVLFMSYGNKDGLPKLKDSKNEDLGSCEDWGIPLEYLHEIKDARFDK